MSIFSNRLRECRERIGENQAAVAKHLNISRQAYTMYESGTRKPDIDGLGILAGYFGVTADYLLGLTDDKRASTPLKQHVDFAALSPESQAKAWEYIEMLKIFEEARAGAQYVADIVDREQRE